MPTAFRHRFDQPGDGAPPRRPLLATPPDVTAMLRAHGLKATLSRVRVLEALCEHAADGHCLASDEIYRALGPDGDIALSIVCTNLALFADAGLAERYRLGEGRTLFSLKQGRRWSAFSVCGGCHRAQGVHNAALDSLLADLAAAQGLGRPEPTVVLRGQCAACANGASNGGAERLHS